MAEAKKKAPAKKTTATKKTTTTKAASAKKVVKKTPLKKPVVAKASVKPVAKKTSPKVTPKKSKSTISWGTVVTSVVLSVLLSVGSVVGVSRYSSSILGSTNIQNMDAAVDAGIRRFIAEQEQKQQDSQQQQQVAQNEQVQKVEGIRADDYVRGDKNAIISIIEYSDYECPFCKRNHPVVQKVVDDFAGDVNWVYRHLPLAFHDPNATDQAEAAECVGELAGEETFWTFTDELYERTRSNKGFPFSSLQPLAEELGVDGANFAACMESDRYLEKVAKQKQEAESMGISGTPANIVLNNETGEARLIGGAFPYSTFESTIKELMGQ